MRSRPWRRGPEPELEVPVEAPPLSVAPIGPAERVAAERAHEVIDLLNPEPALIVDRERLRWAVSFGFVGGDAGGALRKALSRAPVAASDFVPEAFATGLFVQDLIRTCMRVRIGSFEPVLDSLFVARVLSHPPRERAVIEYRRAILGALAEHPGRRAAFQSIYRGLYELRSLLDAQSPAHEFEDRQRKLEVLLTLRNTMEQMAGAFADTDSGLARMVGFARAAVASEGYLRMVELLDYENHMASVELKLRIGADGRIRRFEIERVRENRDNSFHRSALGRWLTRMLLAVRGYSLSEMELVNRWVDTVFEGVQDLLPALLQLLGEMEVYLAALAFKDGAEQKGLRVCMPELVEHGAAAGPRHQLRGLFNPLLLGQAVAPVPCDLELAGFTTTTLVTGPNSGGKTRLLQALGLAQMLGQAGFYAPAAQATLGMARGLFVSLIEEARADQQEGRLGTELLRIRQLFERARPGSLIILDELCSGTNPSEGEDIIRLVLSLLSELGGEVFITTHFLEFARRLSEEPGGRALGFLQVELDPQQCPTYQFIPGVATTSLAHKTAERLGVTRDELLALIARNKR